MGKHIRWVWVLALLGVAVVVGVAQQWPYCASGCTAKDVRILRAWVTNARTQGGVTYADVYIDFEVTAAQRYCIMAAVGFYVDVSCSSVYSVWRMFGDLTQGQYLNQFVGTIQVPTPELWICRLYAIWRNQPYPGCPTGDCSLYQVGSKCWESGDTPYVIRVLVPRDDYYSTCVNTSLTVPPPGVLGNDYVPRPIASLTLVSGPSYGSVTLNFDGSFTYTPNPGWWGDDSFVYQIIDSEGNSGTATVYIRVEPTCGADLSVTKSDYPDPVAAGETLTYTIIVTNYGPSDAQNVVVTEEYPSCFNFVSATPAPDAGTNNRWTFAVLPAGETKTITIQGVVASGCEGAIQNTVTVSSDTYDPTPGNNSWAESTTVTTKADLSIQKSDSPDPVVAGETLTYTIVVTNSGPSDARNVVVTETYPACFIFSSANPAPTQGNNVCNLGTLPAGQSVTITIQGTISPGCSGTIQNTVTVSSDTYDPTPDNNTYTESTTVTAKADLSIQKSDSPDPVVAGETLTYTILVTNSGPSDARNVVVTETYPACFIFGSATPAPDPGTNNRWTMAVIPAGQSVTITIQGTISPGCSGTIQNTVTVTADTYDPAPGNNSWTESTTVTTKADLSIQKSDSPDPVVAGETLTYTIVVKNNGPSDAQNVVVTEEYPACFSFVSATPAPTTGNNVWNLSTIPAGSSVTITIQGTISPGCDGAIQNTVTVTADTYDPTPGNNSWTESTTVTTKADLSIQKSDSPDPVVAGETLTYTVVVTNHGPSNAQNVVVTESYPACFIFGSATPSPTSGNNTWALGTIPAGFSVVITITGTVAPGCTASTLTNTATVSSDTYDPTPGNNTWTEETTVTTRANLAIEKTSSPDPVVAGETLTYTITVTNHGPSNAQNVVVTESYPDGFLFESSEPAPDMGTTNTWTFATIPAGGTETIVITGKVSFYAGGTMTNAVYVNSLTPDPDLSNNTYTLTTQVNAIVIAEDESYTTLEDTALVVQAPGILANDHYPEGAGSLAVLNAPQHGTLVLNEDGAFIYTPNANYYGTDQFIYRLCDKSGNCDTAVVTITVLSVNDPLEVSDVMLRTCMNEAVSAELVAHDPDILWDGFTDHPVSFTLVGGPAHGTLSADWTNVVYTAGQARLSLTYAPDPNFVGTDEFTVRVADPYGEVALITVRIEVGACGQIPVGAAGEILAGPMLIHEIAWAGTSASLEDQWIELRNITNEDIDLTGWVLRWRKKEPQTEEDLIWREIQLRGVIPAHGFFLLERGHDEVVKDVPADLVYPTTMKVGDKEIPLLFSLEGDIVQLLDPQSQVVDTANADPRRPRGWAAGDLATKASMERKGPYLPDLDEHWWTNLGIVRIGKDALEAMLRGTAAALNEPEVLSLQSEPPFQATLGQKVTLTRSFAVKPANEPVVAIVRLSADGPVVRVSFLASASYEVAWNELTKVVALSFSTEGLEVGHYYVVAVFGSNAYLVLRLEIRPA